MNPKVRTLSPDLGALRIRTIAYLRLMRPANILTAMADILLGFAAAASGDSQSLILPVDGEHLPALGWLLLATTGLYGGGVVLNDYFDYDLDKIERPERPLPSGQVRRSEAAMLGGLLLSIGILAAFQVNRYSGLIAMGVAALAVIYDAWGKHHTWLGPLNMGMARAGNLWLGMSVVPVSILSLGFLGLVPVLYIGAITLISQGEVGGGSPKAVRTALLLYGLVFAIILAMGVYPGYQTGYALPFLLLLAYLVLPPLLAAKRSLAAADIRKAVKAGVLALIVLDASLAAGFAGLLYGLLVLALLPLSMALGKLFAVT